MPEQSPLFPDHNSAPPIPLTPGANSQLERLLAVEKQVNLLNDGLNEIKSDFQDIQATHIAIGDLKNDIKFLDFKIDGVEKSLTAKIDDKIDGVEKSLNFKIDGLEKGFSSLKNAVFGLIITFVAGVGVYIVSLIIGH
jgi:hypothetical protein